MKHISKVIKRYKEDNKKAYRIEDELTGDPLKDLFESFGQMYKYDNYGSSKK